MVPLPPIHAPIFAAAWLGLAGVNTAMDIEAFSPYISKALNLPVERLKVSNGGLDGSGLNCADVRCESARGPRPRSARYTARRRGGVRDGDSRSDVAYPRAASARAEAIAPRGRGGVSWVGVSVSLPGCPWRPQLTCSLCDEGSAYWIGRLAVRMLLAHADRIASTDIYSTPCPTLLPFHKDLLRYFEVGEPMELIELIQHTGRWMDGTSDPGEITSRRNAKLAGAARIVLRWAFPEDHLQQPPSPPASDTSISTPGSDTDDLGSLSQHEALALARRAVVPLIDLTVSLLGDRTVVKPERSVLCLGGGLMMSKGYRGFLLEGLRKEGVEWGSVQVVHDAAGVGASGLAAVQNGLSSV